MGGFYNEMHCQSGDIEDSVSGEISEFVGKNKRSGGKRISSLEK